MQGATGCGVTVAVVDDGMFLKCNDEKDKVALVEKRFLFNHSEIGSLTILH